jgi:Mor family transcriptional regulator
MSDVDGIYQQIQGEIHQTVRRLGVAADLSNDIAAAITARLQKLLGSSTVYFPGNRSPDQRYEAIRRDFDGRNHNAVCQKYNISLRTLYRALNRKKLDNR